MLGRDQQLLPFEPQWEEIVNKGVRPYINEVEREDFDDSCLWRSDDFIRLFDKIFAMATQAEPQNWSEKLYNGYVSEVERYVKEIAEPRLKKEKFCVPFLREWSVRWNRHKSVVKGLRALFMYLDRFYSMNSDQVVSLALKGHLIFKEFIFDEYRTLAANFVLDSIQREREGEEQDRHLLHESVQVFIESVCPPHIKNNSGVGTVRSSHPSPPSPPSRPPPSSSTSSSSSSSGSEHPGHDLVAYVDYFETPLLNRSEKFYKEKAAVWLEQDSCPTYLKKVEELLAAEEERVGSYLHARTLEPLHRCAFEHMLKRCQRDLLQMNTGITHLLRTDAKEDLARLFRLYNLFPDTNVLEAVGVAVNKHIAEEGLAIVEQAQAHALSGKKTGAGASRPGTASKGKEKAEDVEMKTEAGADTVEGKKEKGTKTKTPTRAVPSATHEGNHTLVRQLIDLHERYDKLVRVAFQHHQVFQRALKNAFEDFINRDARVSLLLARFAHDVLSTGSKVNVSNVESTLDNVVFLYGYISSKDVFERDYQRFLGERLVLNLCQNQHHEKTMIAKLKKMCGYVWTNKLDGMFNDIQKSKEMMQQFRATHDTESRLDLKLDVNVCTKGYWPQGEAGGARIPADLREACSEFKRFYLASQKGHKLEWRLDQGKAEVQVLFAKGARGLSVTTYQMLILLLFNSSNILTFAQICELTGISKHDIANHILSLAHPNVKVLLKKPNGPALEDGHMFRLNKDFTSSTRRVDIPFRRLEVNSKEEAQEVKVITKQRQCMMDAAIVRIMKTRKRLPHPQLVSEVVTQLQARFKPEARAMRQRIEAMIDQGYMQRGDERNVYEYLA